MTEEQLADWQYAHREQIDAEEGGEVDVDISPRLSVTMSFVQQLAEVFQDLTDARDRLGTVLGDEAPTDDPTAPRQRSGTGA